MKKIIAVAALTAASFAVPTLPVAAEEFQLNCLFFPLLQDECKPGWVDGAAAAPATVAVAVTTDPVWAWPAPPQCERAPEGSKFLYVCE